MKEWLIKAQIELVGRRIERVDEDGLILDSGRLVCVTKKELKYIAGVLG